MATEAEKLVYEAAYQAWRNAGTAYTAAVDAVFRGDPPQPQDLQRLASELQHAHDFMMDKARPILRLKPAR